MATWNLDTAHSVIGFKIKHLMVSNLRGSFTDFEGAIEASDDTFTNPSAHFSAKVASINTSNAGRDGHLQAPDFFDAAQFPLITFASKSFVKNGDKYDVKGDMTMHGVTKEISLTATFEGIATRHDGKRIASFEATGVIDRRDFGISIDMPLQTGGVVIGTDVTLDIQFEAIEA